MKKRLIWVLDNLEEILAGFFLCSTVVLMSSQVVYRYFFGRAIASSEELARFAFLFTVYLAASLAAKHGRHVRVTAQFKIFPREWRKYFIMFADLVWVAFNCVVIYQGFLLFEGMKQYPLVSAVLGWNLRYVFIIIPVAFVLQTFRIIQRYVMLIREGRLDQLAMEGEEF